MSSARDYNLQVAIHSWKTLTTTVVSGGDTMELWVPPKDGYVTQIAGLALFGGTNTGNVTPTITQVSSDLIWTAATFNIGSVPGEVLHDRIQPVLAFTAGTTISCKYFTSGGLAGGIFRTIYRHLPE